MVKYKRISAAALVLISTFGFGLQDQGSPRPKSARPPSIRWEPSRLVNGSPCLFRVRSYAKFKSLSGTWMGHEVFFDFDPTSKSWFGLAGVSVETKPGNYPLVLQAVTSRGATVTLKKSVRIWSTKYPTIALSVAEKFTAPDPQILARVAEEKELKAKVLAVVSPDRQWSGSFAAPVPSTPSDPFGTRRTFNGVVKSMHLGLDYHAPSGTTVAAANGGTVILARGLFYEGNCVVLDHGQGLLTLYMHLSEMKVQEGDKVTRGQQIGSSGASGRATGPHLHIAVRWQGVYVNPGSLLKLQLP